MYIFPIENGDIPASYVSLPEGIIILSHYVSTLLLMALTQDPPFAIWDLLARCTGGLRDLKGCVASQDDRPEVHGGRREGLQQWSIACFFGKMVRCNIVINPLPSMGLVYLPTFGCFLMVTYGKFRWIYHTWMVKECIILYIICTAMI